MSRALATPNSRPLSSVFDGSAYLCTHVCTCVRTRIPCTLTPCHLHTLTFLKNNLEKKNVDYTFAMSVMVSRAGGELVHVD